MIGRMFRRTTENRTTENRTIENHTTENRTIENPNTPLSDPSAWLVDLFGGSTDTGLTVTQHSALTYAPLWRGLNLIARDVAKLPLHLFRRMPDGGREVAREHPSFRLLFRAPSPTQKAFDFRQTLQFHAMLLGNGYAVIFRDGNGNPKELMLVSPSLVNIVISDDNIFYDVTVSKGDRVRFKSREMLHIRGLGNDGIRGYSLLSFARETIGVGLAIRKYTGKFFGNGANPSVILEHPTSLSENAHKALRRDWEAMHSGLSNAHKTAILEEGMKATVLSIDAEKSQMLQLREFEVREIAALLGLPPHKLGDTTRTAFASLEQENQSYLQEALDGWLCQWESEANAKLLSAVERDTGSHFFEFKREAIVRVDLKTQIESLVTEVNNGLLTVNEARAIRNRPMAGPDGDAFRRPANIVIEGDLAGSPMPISISLASHRRLLVATLERMARRLKVHLDRASKDESKRTTFAATAVESHSEAFDEAVLPVVSAICEACNYGDPDDLCERLSCQFFDAVLDVCSGKHEARTSRSLVTDVPDILAEGVIQTVYKPTEDNLCLK